MKDEPPYSRSNGGLEPIGSTTSALYPGLSPTSLNTLYPWFSQWSSVAI
jgi:hypothetical protein